MLPSPITVEDIIHSISKYYKVFVHELAPILCWVYNYARDERGPQKNLVRGSYHSYTQRWKGPYSMYGISANKFSLQGFKNPLSWQIEYKDTSGY